MTDKDKKTIVLLPVKTGRDWKTEKQRINRQEFKHTFIMTGLLGSLTACRFSLRGISNPKNPAAKDWKPFDGGFQKHREKSNE